VHTVAVPAGSAKPSVPSIIAGTGFAAYNTRSTSRRVSVSQTLTGLSQGVEYDIYSVIEWNDVTSVVSSKGSGTTAAGALAAPTNSVAPTISGTPTSGETLTSTNGTWAGSPAPTLVGQWQADGADIGSPGQTTLLLTDNEIGATITRVVTGTNSEGTLDVASNSLGPVAAVVVTPPPSSGFEMTDIASLVVWQHARDLPVGPITTSAGFTDKGGATVEVLNIDGGLELGEVFLNPQGQKVMRIKGEPVHSTGVGRQRLDLTHPDLGNQFTMVGFMRRNNPSGGQRIVIGTPVNTNGVKSAFFYADKSAAGGYGTGAQWGLAQTAPIPANDTEYHLVVIVSDGAATGTAGDPTTKVYVDGVDTFATVADPDAVPFWGTETRIGVSASGSNNGYDLEFTDFAICNGVLSTADRQNAEGYVAHKAGRLDRLATGHPYKVDPP
jgi:hypothetical protein